VRKTGYDRAVIETVVVILVGIAAVIFIVRAIK